MASSSTASSWPASVDELQALLDIQKSAPRTCHGITKAHCGCKRRISEGNSRTIDSKLVGLVHARALTETALKDLETLSGLVICQWKDHREQVTTKFEDWKLKLSNLPSARRSSQRDAPQSSTDNTRAGRNSTGHDERQRNDNASHNRPRRNETPSTAGTSTAGHPERPQPRQPQRPNPTRDERTTGEIHHFESYVGTRTQYAINKKIQDKLLAPLRDREVEEGDVYIFQLPRNHKSDDSEGRCRYVKIGYSGDSDQRLSQIRYACKYRPHKIGSFRMRSYQRFEQIIHLMLNDDRLHEAEGCPGCGRAHKEWFDVSQFKAIGLIYQWQAWSLKNPYDFDGQISLEWRARLQAVDLADPHCWEDFLNEA